jgi:flagellar basal body-associated protein FliL
MAPAGRDAAPTIRSFRTEPGRPRPAGREERPEPTPFATAPPLAAASAAPPIQEAPPQPVETSPPPEDSVDGYDAFASEPPFRARRNPARLWTILAIVAALLMLAAAGAVYWFGVPNLGTALAGKGTPLTVEITGKPERKQLESGNELLAVTGRISNPTEQPQRVPQIRGELRDAQGRIVYQWSIAPPVAELQPKQTVSFNSAEFDVPQSAQALSVTFGSGS